jgi:hypothetical protein
MERRFVIFQQMFIDTKEVEDNLRACGKLSRFFLPKFNQWDDDEINTMDA